MTKKQRRRKEKFRRHQKVETPKREPQYTSYNLATHAIYDRDHNVHWQDVVEYTQILAQYMQKDIERRKETNILGIIDIEFEEVKETKVANEQTDIMEVVKR